MEYRKKYLKIAFTMAEAILTLTIIGVVAALMMRSINRINPDKDKTLFLRSYHAFEAAAGEVVNDTSYFDPDLEVVSDLSTKPLPTARVELNSTEGSILCSTDSRYSDCEKVLSNTNSICYLVAGRLNLTGVVDCSDGDDVMNFRTGNGVCFYGLAGRVAPFDFVIEPGCKGVEHGYAARVLPSGNMTVPESSSYDSVFENENNQKIAFKWINEQTDVKKKNYDFDEKKD